MTGPADPGAATADLIRQVREAVMERERLSGCYTGEDARAWDLADNMLAHAAPLLADRLARVLERHGPHPHQQAPDYPGEPTCRTCIGVPCPCPTYRAATGMPDDD